LLGQEILLYHNKELLEVGPSLLHEEDVIYLHCSSDFAARTMMGLLMTTIILGLEDVIKKNNFLVANNSFSSRYRICIATPNYERPKISSKPLVKEPKYIVVNNDRL